MPVYRLTIGISDHVAGPDLAALLSRVSAFDPKLHLDVRIDLSGHSSMPSKKASSTP